MPSCSGRDDQRNAKCTWENHLFCCVSKLPDHLLGVNTGSALSDAYVVKIDDSGLGAPAWFIHKNMPKSMSSDDVCHNLLILISSLFPDAAHECRPPKNE